MTPAEELLLAELALMSDETLVEYVLQEDYYTSAHWEAVARLKLDRRGKVHLPEQRQAERAAWLRRTR